MTKPLVIVRMKDLSVESVVPSKVQKATLRDVAQMAGVSPFTVSTVLNGTRSSTRVSNATRERIQDAAKALGYRPNTLARSLKRQRTDIVGLYFGYGSLEPHDPFHAEVLTGLQRGCEQQQKDLMIHYSFHHFSSDQVFEALAGGKIDGLILLTYAQDPLVVRMRDSGLLVVAITDALEGIPSVVADDEAGSHLIAEHLFSKGHRKVVYRMCPGESDSAHRRYQSFVARASQLGIEVVPLPSEDWRGELSPRERDFFLSLASSHVTAAVCWGDPCANALLKFCFDQRIDVPSQLAIVGFNGIQPNVEPKMRLSTVQANWSKVAETAVNLLAQRIDGHSVPLWTTIPVTFQSGDTT